MRRRFNVLLPLAVGGVAVIALFLVGGGAAAPQRTIGGSPSATHYQQYPVADFDVATQLFPDGGNASIHTGLAITSLTVDNPSSTKVVAGVQVNAGCNGSGGALITRVVIPAQETVHLEYSGEPLLAFSTASARIDNGWCLEIFPDGDGVGNVIATIVGYTYKP